MRKTIILLCVISCGAAHAATFHGSTSGVFNNPVGANRMKTHGVGTNSFDWGRVWGSSPVSSLRFQGKGFEAANKAAFVLGNLSYTNGTILNGTDAKKVDLEISFDVNPPVSNTKKFTFHLDLINTQNKPDPKESADIIHFRSGFPAPAYTLGDEVFTLEFLGFGKLTGQGFTVADSFRVMEHGSASVDLLGRFNTVSAPVPTAIWLFASALLGLAGLRKNRESLRQ